MQLIHSLQMEGFYGSDDNKSPPWVSAREHRLRVCAQGGTCIVLVSVLLKADHHDAHL